MGHGKLRKFAENETFSCLLQPSAADVLVKEEGSRELVLRDHPVKGRWKERFFGGSEGEIVLEIGCGKGDYVTALSARCQERNFIGVDIKGARLWKGAKFVTENGVPNVAFLRTRAEFLPAFFGPGEVSEIWLTFSDPQLSGSGNSRLSSPFFLDRYRSFLKKGGTVHLKTDSRFLYEYTMSVVKANSLDVIAYGTDIYKDGLTILDAAGTDPDAVTGVQTFYEKMFLGMGIPITYLAFRIDHEGPFTAPSGFDAAFWKEAEGPRRSFSHQPSPQGTKRSLK